MKILYKHYTLTMLFCTMMAAGAYAQIAEDALMISRTGPIGTARILGLGGGGVALGGDASSAYINPAGLGFYNRSQLVLTPSFQNARTNTRFLGSNSETFDNNFNVSNFGIVINNTKDDIIPADYRGGSFAITYNQTNSYNVNYSFQGENDFSLLDEFALQANGVGSDELFENATDGFFPRYIDAAYENYLINAYPNDPDSYVASIPLGTRALQNGLVEEIGRQSEWDFSYGGNYKDKIYFGASVGFRNFTYEKISTFDEQPLYTEEYAEDGVGFPFFPVDNQLSIDFVDFVTLNETLRIDGSGINATLGLIYRPVNELTLGFSYKTPTFYSITEEYFFDLRSSVLGIQESDDDAPFDLSDPDPLRSPSNFSEYTLSTPSKVSGGFAYFFEKYGFITADVEYVNYAANRFSSNEFNTGDVNTEIDDVMESVINYKVGGEFRYDIFRLRAGYAMYTDPTQYVEDNLDRDRQVLSGGVGISTPKFFADLAVVNTQYSTDFFPYQGSSYFPIEDIPQTDNNTTNVVLSVGFNF
ncbi:OmpP1/FadL family transporter [Catalinimonas niigatensis]|uniref:OmpP1/FadL family transporter n=1 Tax=Catalinimonas niigatensis TaxID=1397264 RepID=UPI0026650120|nr:hypothetical protein [Catalinimonas niigatensis]WPP49019.1 hypothetical protein PZB72_20335 [Catalinimonas niigatensis]